MFADKRLVYFDGDDLSIAEQVRAFRSATVVIGAHGGGLANIMWTNIPSTSCSDRPKVIEFLCGQASVAVQNGCPYGKTYWNLAATIPWVDYHHVLYTSNSTNKDVYIDLEALGMAMDRVLS